MINGPRPAWSTKAREFQARVASPLGKPFAAARKQTTCQLYLYDAIGIDPWTGTGIDPMDVVKAIQEAKDATALEVHINSPGGGVFDGIAIFNAIRAFDGPRTVYVDGVAASIASVIALAGDRVITSEGSMWMVHDPAGGCMVWGTADEIDDACQKTVTALRKVRDNILDIYASNTGRGVGELSAWMTAETWMTANEAVERGFSDEVQKQEPAEPAPEPDAKVRAAPDAAPARARTAEELVATARAQASEIRSRFAGASPGAQQPGQPGAATTHTPARRQENSR